MLLPTDFHEPLMHVSAAREKTKDAIAARESQFESVVHEIGSRIHGATSIGCTDTGYWFPDLFSESDRRQITALLQTLGYQVFTRVAPGYVAISWAEPDAESQGSRT